MIHNTHFKGFWPQLQSSFIVEQLSAVNLFLCKNSWWLLLLVTFVTVWWLRMMTEHQTFRKKPIWFAQYNSLFCLILNWTEFNFTGICLKKESLFRHQDMSIRYFFFISKINWQITWMYDMQINSYFGLMSLKIYFDLNFNSHALWTIIRSFGYVALNVHKINKH